MTRSMLTHFKTAYMQEDFKIHGSTGLRKKSHRQEIGLSRPHPFESLRQAAQTISQKIIVYAPRQQIFFLLVSCPAYRQCGQTRHSKSNNYTEHKACLDCHIIPRPIRDWNNLPTNIMTIIEPELFKKAVIQYLSEQDKQVKD